MDYFGAKNEGRNKILRSRRCSSARAEHYRNAFGRVILVLGGRADEQASKRINRSTTNNHTPSHSTLPTTMNKKPAKLVSDLKPKPETFYSANQMRIVYCCYYCCCCCCCKRRHISALSNLMRFEILSSSSSHMCRAFV